MSGLSVSLSITSMKAPENKAHGRAEATPPVGELSAPWSIPGPEKEHWKERGHRYDLRKLDASRPFDLSITISLPRQSVSA